MTEYICLRKCYSNKPCRMRLSGIHEESLEMLCPRGLDAVWVRVGDFSKFAKGQLYYDSISGITYEVEEVFDDHILAHKWDDPEVEEKIYDTSSLVERAKACLHGYEMEKLVGKVVRLPDDSCQLVTGCSYDASMGYHVVIAGKKYTAEELMDDELMLINGSPLYTVTDKVSYED